MSLELEAAGGTLKGAANVGLDLDAKVVAELASWLSLTVRPAFEDKQLELFSPWSFDFASPFSWTFDREFRLEDREIGGGPLLDIEAKKEELERDFDAQSPAGKADDVENSDSGEESSKKS